MAAQTCRRLAVIYLWGCVLPLVAWGADASSADQEDALRKERERLRGTWRIVALEHSGNKVDEAEARKLTVVNGADDQWTLFQDGNALARGVNKLDPTQQPKAIDITLTEADGKEQKYRAIYELKDKTRRLCIAPLGKDRPAEFSTTLENEHILIHFEREETK
jgi:uncharacterized protein (TIGR03067 family)